MNEMWDRNQIVLSHFCNNKIQQNKVSLSKNDQCRLLIYSDCFGEVCPLQAQLRARHSATPLLMLSFVSVTVLALDLPAMGLNLWRWKPRSSWEWTIVPKSTSPCHDHHILQLHAPLSMPWASLESSNLQQLPHPDVLLRHNILWSLILLANMAKTKEYSSDTIVQIEPQGSRLFS